MLCLRTIWVKTIERIGTTLNNLQIQDRGRSVWTAEKASVAVGNPANKHFVSSRYDNKNQKRKVYHHLAKVPHSNIGAFTKTG